MPRFVKVMPLDYKRVLTQIQEQEQEARSDQILADYIVAPTVPEIEVLEEVS
jgi:hypothetical protein